jgi:hypothetical protein
MNNTPPQPPPPHAQLTPIPIPDPVLRAVYASDQSMYPVPLPYSRLRAWVDASPDLSICFQDSAAEAAAVAGVIVVLPLRRRHWEDLLVGRLKEPDVEAGSMFPDADTRGGGVVGGDCGAGREEEEVGLHVYHVERFGVESSSGFGKGVGGKRFSEYALAEVMKRVEARPGWKVLGLSGMAPVLAHFVAEDVLMLGDVALTATPAGKRTFERLAFTPTGYRELFVAKGLGEGSDGAEEEQQAEMVCIYPGDETEYESVYGGRVIVAMSEMTVKYSNSLNLG